MASYGEPDFKSMEEQFSEEEKAKNNLRVQIHATAELWPEFLAMYSGMVKQAIDDGWEEIAARSIVLASITGAPNMNVIANLPGNEEDGTLDGT